MMRLATVLLAATAAVDAFAPAPQRLSSQATRTAASVAAPLRTGGASASCSTLLPAQLLQDQDITQKYYMPQAKEMPKVLGGLKIGLRDLVVVTGASSGLGLNCAATLAKSGKYFVVMACRDVEKGKRGKPHEF